MFYVLCSLLIYACDSCIARIFIRIKKKNESKTKHNKVSSVCNEIDQKTKNDLRKKAYTRCVFRVLSITVNHVVNNHFPLVFREWKVWWKSLTSFSASFSSLREIDKRPPGLYHCNKYKNRYFVLKYPNTNVSHHLPNAEIFLFILFS